MLHRLIPLTVALFALMTTAHNTAYGAYTIKNGSLIDTGDLATMSAHDHLWCGFSAYQECNWREAAQQFRIVTINFPGWPDTSSARFYLGICYFQLDEFDSANEAFSEYLRCTNNPTYFQDAVYYKFCIAEKFRCGAKRRYFGTQKLPKWACGKELALQIYDEVIAALPSSELAANSLFSKACLLWEMGEFRCAVEAFQQLTKRFPKHELAPESYLMINRVFLQQAFSEYQNPDLLAFSALNYKRFQQDFPGEERLGEALADVQAIKEIYAYGLYETGAFYEKICKPRAAMIYYFSAVNEFPDTEVARYAGYCLSGLDPTFNFDLYVQNLAKKEAAANAKLESLKKAATEREEPVDEELKEIYDFGDDN